MILNIQISYFLALTDPTDYLVASAAVVNLPCAQTEKRMGTYWQISLRQEFTPTAGSQNSHSNSPPLKTHHPPLSEPSIGCGFPYRDPRSEQGAGGVRDVVTLALVLHQHIGPPAAGVQPALLVGRKHTVRPPRPNGPPLRATWLPTALIRCSSRLLTGTGTFGLKLEIHTKHREIQSPCLPKGQNP